MITPGLALRSLLWTALLPGLFAGYLSLRFFGLARVQVSFSNPALRRIVRALYARGEGLAAEALKERRAP